VVDCGGDLGVATGAPRDAVVLVVKTGRASADWTADQWLKAYGSSAVVVTADQAVVLEEAEGGFVGRLARSAVGLPGAREGEGPRNRRKP